MKRFNSSQLSVFLLILFLINISVLAQRGPAPNDTLDSYQIHSDKQVTFKVYAPNANAVKLGGAELLNMVNNKEMEKTEEGIWRITVGPLKPGSYRYNFNIDGVSVIDPCNPLTSQSNMNSWSLIHVKGADFMDKKDVPHGAISEITYYSNSLQRFRRMHVYTPPGYESGNNKYPIFYLLHGALDSDDSWSTVGRTGFIMDNLIAQNKAEPMVIVMPAGHTGPFWFGMDLNISDFLKDFNNDIMPTVEKRYRVLNNRENRAIAGLSMGGAQTLNIAIPNLQKFAYVGVFSSGILGFTDEGGLDTNTESNWEEQNKQYLDNDKLKKELKLIWFGIGEDDFLIKTSRATVDMLENHGFNVDYKETTGGHTWQNWRQYLYEFSQKLFKS
ncbi:MAG: esterase [Candidatus Marinimicrobia bacterium]|nr:esterase [Candidatus Neomarinimicrobiota bacterium]